jgi:hypothetical protein
MRITTITGSKSSAFVETFTELGDRGERPLHRAGMSAALFAAFVGLALLNACAVDDQVPEGEPEELESEIAGSGNVVTAWAAIAIDAIVRPDEAATTLRSPGPSTMLMAQVQLAVYDTMMVFDREYESFSFRASRPSYASQDAAVATAAYRILKTRVPLRGAYLDVVLPAAAARADLVDVRHGV